ncbi:MAG: hypothetical protein ACRDRT_08190 [Pseudonocardiaceae bacterium]
MPLADWFQSKGQPALELWRTFDEPTNNILPGATHLPCKARLQDKQTRDWSLTPVGLSARDFERRTVAHDTGATRATFADTRHFA